MAKATWWVCDSCRSLNDMPANKCYKCRTQKPDNPTLIDSSYAQVAGPQARVGISVQRSRVGELSAQRPVETQRGSGAFQAYGSMDDQPLESVRTAGEPKSPPPPLREPPRRSIAQAGGYHWEHGLSGADRVPEGAGAPYSSGGPPMPAPGMPGPG
ncbi:MAG TPA: hypothetical protein VJZ50_04325, partial [Candidatus Limnocylindrales bacterium]|nr:hypothetical protein [Candidatus Limnocylindrales bacterium]